MNSTVVIPTLNAGGLAERQIAAILAQTVVPNIIVVDSSSSDNTAREFSASGAKVVIIQRDQFHHAQTRNLGAGMATSDYVVFLTQDSIPANEQWLAKLLEPLATGIASASYSRQLPLPTAKPMERYARQTNYPAESHRIVLGDFDQTGIMAQFFSNSASAVRLDVFNEVGGFPTGTVQNEDMQFAARLLRHGHAISYVAESTVLHSHELSLAQVFKRYFDIGTVISDAGTGLITRGMSAQGIRYVLGLVRYLYESKELQYVPAAIGETAAKFAGSIIGRNYRSLPKRLVPLLSSNSGYWQRRLGDETLP